jgi:menaquinone-dependent protoporphyrinogen oxidase
MAAFLTQGGMTMHSVLIVHASRHGGTAGIADRLGESLRNQGIEAMVAPASSRPNPVGFDAVLVGSGVYMGSWLRDGIDYLELNVATLATRPTWFFSSGPLPSADAPKPADVGDRYDGALGPAEGPGSGGRKAIEGLAERIGIRGHKVFQGRFDPNDPPKVLAERIARLLPPVKNILPDGDFREWDVIDAWAVEIAAEVKGLVAVG